MTGNAKRSETPEEAYIPFIPARTLSLPSLSEEEVIAIGVALYLSLPGEESPENRLWQTAARIEGIERSKL